MRNSEEAESHSGLLLRRWIRSDVVEAIGLSALTVCACLLVQWRYGFNWSDEGLLWYVSQRTALGQVPLLDFFSYDPGRYYWSAAVFKILRGNGLFEQIMANDAFGFLGLVAVYLAMSRSRLTRPWRIAILLLLGVMLGHPRHKIYEQAMSLFAVAGIAMVLARPDRIRRWFFQGVATGLAAFLGRNSGVYFLAAALLAFILLRISGWKIPVGQALGSLAAGIVIGYLPLLWMLCFIHGFAWVFYQSVLTSPHVQIRLPIPWPWRVDVEGLHGVHLLYAETVPILCLAVPVGYSCVVLGWLACKGKWDNARRLACAAAIAGVPYLHHAFSRSDFDHIAEGVVPFAVAVGAFCQYFWKAQRRKLAVGIFAGLAGLVLACWLPREPLVEFWRRKAHDPQGVAQIEIGGRTFEVIRAQAEVMRATETAFRRCGAGDGRFLAAPNYPGLYAFLDTRAPFWELYYLFPRSIEFQREHIEALAKNGTSVVLLNREAAIDGLDSLRMDRTNGELVQYLMTHYQPSNIKLPAGFEIRYLSQECTVE
jgi:hypothetical protein